MTEFSADLESIAFKQLKSNKFEEAVVAFTNLLAVELSATLFIGRRWERIFSFKRSAHNYV